MRPTVRPARASDGPAFLALLDGLARYEKLEPPSAEARQRLLEDAFGPRPRLTVLLGELGGEAAAYAILLETYSSFLARPTLWIEDIFVAPEARRRGMGRAMMRGVAAEAVRRGCHRIEGAVLAWNEPAQAFYRATGGQVLGDWHVLRYDRAALEALAR